MPLFLIERNFAQDVNLDEAGIREVRQINDEVGVNGLCSFLSADKRTTDCLYEAPSEAAIRIAARRANVPADVIVPVGSVPAAESPAARYSVLRSANARTA
jgi:hypothetical protein